METRKIEETQRTTGLVTSVVLAIGLAVAVTFAWGYGTIDQADASGSGPPSRVDVNGDHQVALGDLIWRVTGFTLGHTVTLIAGFLGFTPSVNWFLPSVDAAIALSIVYAGVVALLRHAAPITIAITAMLGLLHSDRADAGGASGRLRIHRRQIVEFFAMFNLVWKCS